MPPSQEDLLRGSDASPSARPPRRLVDNSADVIGVADGVGGWRQYGVDPGQFSSDLMRNCERLVKAGYYIANQPAKLLAQAFRYLGTDERGNKAM